MPVVSASPSLFLVFLTLRVDGDVQAEAIAVCSMIRGLLINFEETNQFSLPHEIILNLEL